MIHTAEEAKVATGCQLSLGRLGKRSQTSYVNILRTVEARPEVHRVERVACFYMVAIPEAAIPTDRDRIGTPPPQRVEPYKNTLEKRLHNT